jgi:hypothetical protein
MNNISGEEPIKVQKEINKGLNNLKKYLERL